MHDQDSKATDGPEGRLDDALEALRSVGPMRCYRATPEAAIETTARMDKVIAESRAVLASEEDTGDRLRRGFEVARTLVDIARSRADMCIHEHQDIACESIDVFQLIIEWIDIVQSETRSGTPTPTR
ncbi:MAG: hypothetical protein CMJ83_23000 [Planctomycetes bacterium]|nr:hypothetical protein [Planctomycetota bacterium]